MIPYSLLLAWVWIEVFSEEAVSPRLSGSAVIFPYVRKAAANFFLLTIWAAFYFWAVRIWPGRENIFQAAGVLVFYGLSISICRRSFPLVMMTYAAAFWLAQMKNPALIPLQAAKAVCFVSGVCFIWRGLRYRLLLSSIPKKIAGLPEFFITAALIATGLSFLWIGRA